MDCRIEFPPTWVSASEFEQALLSTTIGPHRAANVTMHFPVGCKIIIDAAVRILSLANQLAACSRRVKLQFDEGDAGAMGYLNRMGFYDLLSTLVDVLPKRPTFSSAEVYAGTNAGLVEIARISADFRDQNLPTRLSDAIAMACTDRDDVKELEGAAWTIFAELIDNIFSHSQTRLDGYAALQVYQRGNRIRVAVSDSGLGIMQTLRPALQQESPGLAQLSDLELLVEVFRQGISRHGADRGCGLKGSAAKAMKFQAELDVRLPNIRVLLTPGEQGYRPNTAYCFDQLPLLWGTHICFSFGLTRRRNSR